MPGEGKNGMQCAEFDALLGDALDGGLTGAKLESFRAHARACSLCGPLLAEAEEGRRWLKSLTEVEAPANLVQNILAATSGVESARSIAKPAVSWKEAVAGWLRPVFAPAFAVARQPRFAMSFGMAFFSLSVALSMSGVKVKDLQKADLRPSTIKRTYYETTGRVVKYYENIRFVYELESRVQQFKRATTPEEPRREEPKKERKDNNTSEEPEKRQERNYSQGDSHIVVADLRNDRPVVTVTTYRRLV
jgi:putative zinc finger protein